MLAAIINVMAVPLIRIVASGPIQRGASQILPQLDWFLVWVGQHTSLMTSTALLSWIE
jgi:hypothetical protein